MGLLMKKVGICRATELSTITMQKYAQVDRNIRARFRPERRRK